MSIWIVLAVAVLATAAALAVLLPRLNTRRLQQRFGPEYDRTVRAHGGRTGEAEHELAGRLRQARQLALTRLPQRRAEEVGNQLAALQELFVDDPARSLDEAMTLLDGTLDEIGFPAEDRLAVLSVDHAALVPDYRTARQVQERSRSERVGTEELRTALLAVRDLCLEVARSGGDEEGRTAHAGNSTGAVHHSGPRHATR
ncbi:hypothetical protein OG401_40980 [Kitasatospora purpeofusca]|uniref:hypothetical protein n=1 Tax=Kitasatospora purpeofusca TaxID=67352 RepID=UPI00224D8CEF|nr:hypothetical protein [Kitasatospora purpeofusca]MCX4690594.1 hypothetical protein [Kitasatospora purpeofusca]